MGRLLDGLRAEPEAPTSANPANPANLGGLDPEDSQIREIRGAPEVENQRRRERLLALADSEGLAAGLVHGQPDAELALCDQLPEDGVRAYLRALDASDRIGSGLVPAGWSQQLDCAHCGPVWWQRSGSVLACPWCARQQAGKPFPRPPVACQACWSFQPGAINPEAALGACKLSPDRRHYPGALHACPDWRQHVGASGNDAAA